MSLAKPVNDLFTMERVMIAVTLALFLGIPGLSKAQCLLGTPAEHAPEGVKLIISADKTKAKPREDVTVHIELSNSSKLAIALWDWWLVERGYEVHVLNVHGLEAPLTEWGAMIRRPPIKGSGNPLALAPGEKVHKEEKLSKVYDISEPGFYTVQVCRDLIGYGNIYSNKVQIEIQ